MEQEPKFYVDRQGFVRASLPSVAQEPTKIAWMQVFVWAAILHGVLAFWGLVYWVHS